MKPDLEAIRARWPEGRLANTDARADVLALLAHVDMLEHMLAEERENVDTLRARVAELKAARDCLPPVNAEHEAIVDGMLAKSREGVAKRPIGTYSPGETEWANRIAHAEARFVDEYDLRKAAERQVEELKARIVTLEAMKP